MNSLIQNNRSHWFVISADCEDSDGWEDRESDEEGDEHGEDPDPNATGDLRLIFCLTNYTQNFGYLGFQNSPIIDGLVLKPYYCVYIN